MGVNHTLLAAQMQVSTRSPLPFLETYRRVKDSRLMQERYHRASYDRSLVSEIPATNPVLISTLSISTLWQLRELKAVHRSQSHLYY